MTEGFRILRLSFTLSAAACSIMGIWRPVGAQSVESEADPEPPRYEVELVIFRHLDQGPNTPEVAPLPVIAPPEAVEAGPIEETGILQDPDAPEAAAIAGEPPIMVQRPVGSEDEEAQRPVMVRRRDAAEDDEPQRPPIDFYLLEIDPQLPDFLPIESDELVLDPVYERLVRLDAYSPVLQLAWTQGARGRDVAQPYFISASDTDVTGLSGTIRLYKERYLHLELNLSFRPDAIGSAEAGFSAEPLSRRDEVIGALPPAAHRIRGSRRVRTEEIHYFDHPGFGVIASVLEIKPDQEPASPSP